MRTTEPKPHLELLIYWCPSISKFANEAAAQWCELREVMGTSKSMILVPLRSEVPEEILPRVS
jgi:hypothetical protein